MLFVDSTFPAVYVFLLTLIFRKLLLQTSILLKHFPTRRITSCLRLLVSCVHNFLQTVQICRGFQLITKTLSILNQTCKRTLLIYEVIHLQFFNALISVTEKLEDQ